MEGGRQVEVSKAILGAKGVPYIVAAPLLIQGLHSWMREGIAGLQVSPLGFWGVCWCCWWWQGCLVCCNKHLTRINGNVQSVCCIMCVKYVILYGCKHDSALLMFSHVCQLIVLFEACLPVPMMPVLCDVFWIVGHLIEV